MRGESFITSYERRQRLALHREASALSASNMKLGNFFYFSFSPLFGGAIFALD